MPYHTFKRSTKKYRLNNPDLKNEEIARLLRLSVRTDNPHVFLLSGFYRDTNLEVIRLDDEHLLVRDISDHQVDRLIVQIADEVPW